MPATIHRLTTKKERLNQEQTELFRDALTRARDDNPDVPWPEDAVRRVLSYVDRLGASNNGWNFVQVSPQVNDAIAEWLEEHARRPAKAMRVWGKLLTALDTETGQILLSRAEIAEQVGGIDANYVSEIMAHLQDMHIVSSRRARRPGVRGLGPVCYFLNPLAATQLGGLARDKAQAEAPPLRVGGLRAIEGGRPA